MVIKVISYVALVLASLIPLASCRDLKVVVLNDIQMDTGYTPGDKYKILK